MNRPVIKKIERPKHIKDYPVGPCFDAGHLVTENSSWRSEKPIVDRAVCNGCFYCYLCCPEGVIFKDGGKINIEYSFCKGCGICVKACHKKAIQMVREG